MCHPNFSAIHCSLRAAAFKYGSHCENRGQNGCSKEWGKEPLTALVQPESHLVVTSFQLPPSMTRQKFLQTPLSPEAQMSLRYAHQLHLLGFPKQPFRTRHSKSQTWLNKIKSDKAQDLFYNACENGEGEGSNIIRGNRRSL